MPNNQQTSVKTPAQLKWIRRLSDFLKISLLAIVYYAVAWLQAVLEAKQYGMIPLPLAVGVALAALLMFGIRLWIGIALGCVCFKLLEGVPNPELIFSTLGAVTQAVIAAVLLKHYRFQRTFSTLRDIWVFTSIVLTVTPIVGATITNTVFFLSDILLSQSIPLQHVITIWLTNWFSDGMGMLVVTPVLLVWRELPPVHYRQGKRLLELGILLICLILISSLMLHMPPDKRLLLLYITLPFIIIAALRFEQHGATVAVLLVAGMLFSSGFDTSLANYNNFASHDLLIELSFMSMIALMALLVAAVYTEHHHTEVTLYLEKEHALKTIHSIAHAVITTNQQGRVTYLNPTAEEITGWVLANAIGKSVIEVFTLKHIRSSNPIERCLHGVISPPLKNLLLTFDKQEITIESSVAPIRNKTGKIEGMVIVFHDTSKTRQLRDRLTEQTNHDVVTGLYNRQEFEYQFAISLSSAKIESKTHIFVYLVLDQFKFIFDHYGHRAGDALLKQWVCAIKTRLRSSDTFARLKEGEFGLLLANCPLEQAEAVVDAFLKAVRNFYFTWKDQTIEIRVSIGATPIDANSESYTAAFAQVQRAYQMAKQAGGNCVYIETGNHRTLVTTQQTEIQLVNDLIKAMQENRLVLYCQPIMPIDTSSSAEISYEILIRLCDEKGTIISPSRFIPAAEHYQLMPKIDRWVVHTALTRLTQQSPTDPKINRVAINLSNTTLNDSQFIPFIRDELAFFKISPDCLCFELDEINIIDNLHNVTQFMQAVNQLGCRLAIDNVSGKLASFHYLKNLPVNYLKIDGGLIREMAASPIDRAIVESIIHIGRIVNCQLIAEWVEDEATLTALKLVAIDFVQGFGIAKPEPFLPS